MAQEEQTNISPELLARVTNSAGIFQLLGLHIETVHNGIGRVRVSVDERLMHPQMIVHGGVIFTLADTAMSMAILSVNPPGTRTGTIEAKINYLLPVRTGELLAEAHIVHQGRSTAVLEATVFNIVDGEQKAIARLLGTFSVARPKNPLDSGETGTNNSKNHNEHGK
ncbi:MAG TPA: PaaI family thioesterase [Ktedonobacteraceae bacterium]|nr:PaaI family thioesterase [Ktedonobacteraceae bacterium]